MSASRPESDPPRAAPDDPSPGPPTLLPSPDAPEDPERAWLRDVYQGDRAPQLTWRAVVMGGLIGCVLCLSNLYSGLRTGIASAVAVTACLVSYAAHGALVRLAPRWFGPRMGLLEDNAMQTTASAAGYATGSTLASAGVAYLLLTGQHVPPLTLLLWTFCCSALGAFFAIPLKRQLINRERLPFPSGTAAATTLRALHGGGDGARAGARALGLSGALAALLATLRDGLGVLPHGVALPGRWRGLGLGDLTLSLEVSALPMGLGALVGLRTAASMLLGAAICYGLLAPALHAAGALSGLGYGGIVTWSMWPGTALLATAALTQLAFQGRALARGARTLWSAARGGGGPDPLAAVELPRRWFWTGLATLSLATVALAWSAFGIPPAYGLLAVALSFALGVVACRVTGETDGTPTSALCQVTQLTYAGVMPQELVANLMTSSVTGNSTAVAADLLSDLKSGHLLGANPRRQFLAQLIGCALGAVAVVPFFYLLVPDASAVGGERFPAPAAQSLLGVARALGAGLDQLPTSVRWAVLVAGLLGVILTALERLLPPRPARLVPSAMGLGLAFLLPASTALSVFVGGLGASLLQRARPRIAGLVTVPAASGLIAGESVIAVGAAVLAASGVLR